MSPCPLRALFITPPGVNWEKARPRLESDCESDDSEPERPVLPSIRQLFPDLTSTSPEGRSRKRRHVGDAHRSPTTSPLSTEVNGSERGHIWSNGASSGTSSPGSTIVSPSPLESAAQCPSRLSALAAHPKHVARDDSFNHLLECLSPPWERSLSATLHLRQETKATGIHSERNVPLHRRNNRRPSMNEVDGQLLEPEDDNYTSLGFAGKSFDCAHCGKGFSTSSNLSRHKRAAHAVGPGALRRPTYYTTVAT